MQPDKLMAMMQKNDKVDINAFKKLYLDCLRHLEGARFKKASTSLFDNGNCDFLFANYLISQNSRKKLF